MADKLDMIYRELTEFREETRNGFEKMNGRVRELEIWRWKMAGAVALAFAALAVLRVVI